MATARESHTENIVLGAGEIFIDRYNDDGEPTGGEVYLGDSLGMTLSVTTERTTIQSGDGAVARDLVDQVRSVTRTLGFTLHDSSPENWALFLIGEEGSAGVLAAKVASGAAGTTFDAMEVGKWYQLGQSAANPSGPGAITKPAKGDIKNGAAANSRQAINDADYAKLEFDIATARVRLTAAFATPANNSVEILYTPTEARTISQAKASAAAKQITCAIRYLEVPGLAGDAKGRNLYARKCNLIPTGEAAFKSRDTEQQLAFTATILDPGSADGYPPVVIDGEAA